MPNKSLREQELEALLAERDAIIADQKRRIEILERQVAELASQLESLLGGKKQKSGLPDGPGLFPDLVAEVGDGDEEPDDAEDEQKPGNDRKKKRKGKREIDTTGLAQRDVLHELLDQQPRDQGPGGRAGPGRRRRQAGTDPAHPGELGPGSASISQQRG